jgi:uncharacterized membrane protein
VEELIIAVLGGAIIYLWNRTSDMQRQIEWLRELIDAAPAKSARSAVEPVAMTTPATRIAPLAAPDEQTVLSNIPRVAAPKPQVETRTKLEPEPEPVELSQQFALPKISLDFEDLFGRRLPIWAGGIALAVAGFFLVRHSIEAGLITPSVRVILGFVFGLALLAAAEAAFRFEGIIKDERVRQALAGAGLATLYASFYLAGSVYGLLGSTLSFVGLAAVTAAAIGLSFRFGLPCAILGLVGGFAAPTLVGSEEANLPMLALYLALVTAGLALTGKRQDRAWLGLASLGGALGWGVLLLTSGFNGVMDTLAVGGFLLLLGAAMPLLLANDSLRGFGRMVVAGLATLQMAALVDHANYSFLAWSLYALLAAAIAVLGWKFPRMREGSAVAGATALWMLAIWPDPVARDFAIIGGVFAAIFAGMPPVHLLRRQHRTVDVWQLSAFPLGLIAAAIWHFAGDFDTMQTALAGTALALAAFPVTATWRLWPKAEEPLAPEAAITLASATIALFAAGILATPLWAAPLVGGVLSAAIAALGWGRSDRAFANIGWGLAWATLVACVVTVDDFAQLDRIFGHADSSGPFNNVLRWSAISLAFVLLAVGEQRKLLRRTAEVFAALFAYVAIAQIVPAYYLAWVTAAAAILLAWRLPAKMTGQITLLVIAGFWSLSPLFTWVEADAGALFGIPILASELPGVMTAAMRIVPVLAAGAGLLWFAPGAYPATRKAILAGIVALGFVAGHVLFKQLFAIDSFEQFRDIGLVERSVWQALLLAIAYGLYRHGAKAQSDALTMAGQVTAGAAFAHFTYFTILLHNPLWAEQWVGPWPIVTLLLPAYAVGIAALLLLRRLVSVGGAITSSVFDAVLMALISLLALSELRNVFAGEWLTSTPMTQTEDLLRSLLGIVLAIAFLLWGSRTGSRSWRIGSLVLMLGAVLKVFLLDTAALEGLARIASFMALGFSLIGIGWFYSKQLAKSAKPA